MDHKIHDIPLRSMCHIVMLSSPEIICQIRLTVITPFEHDSSGHDNDTMAMGNTMSLLLASSGNFSFHVETAAGTNLVAKSLGEELRQIYWTMIPHPSCVLV